MVCLTVDEFGTVVIGDGTNCLDLTNETAGQTTEQTLVISNEIEPGVVAEVFGIGLVLFVMGAGIGAIVSNFKSV